MLEFIEMIENIFFRIWNALYVYLGEFFGVEVNPDWIVPVE